MSKVDLFIPTYNRPEFLRRLLNYYSYFQFKHRIIVADSSTNQNKKINKNIVLQFKDLNILYLDKFSSKQISHHKFGEMVKYAKSKFCVFCADDDFLIPSGIEEAVDFLENHPDYSGVHGSYIAFYIYDKIPGLKKFLWRFIYSIKTINSPDPLTRLKFHIENYNQVLWAVRRTDVVKKAYSEFVKFKVSPILFGELTPDMLTVILGKVKRINIFYSARQAFSTAYSYWPSLQDAINDNTYPSEYKKFKECLMANIKLKNPDIEKEIDKSMEKYLQLSNQEHLTGRLNLLLRKFPSIISSLIRQLHILYLYSKESKDIIGNMENPNSKYYQDLVTLKKFVTK